ncbi:Cas4 exonuclease [Mycobacterium phage Rockstar]|uniref:Cas4 exonuclease n=3 Tax=Veracruzvirus TaxID=2948946 RepID=A0A6M3T183_9CAUD|nr:exonuclease [Mycobacterium phage BTCU-1]YP_009614587.1 exonuclease [Mycobacterium phage Rockstar]QJD52043.1 Cas4 exonuclease [Mycobacterium phage MK4]QJD52200.1 Cas4 exonuclease [Mycobacterium phage JF4]QJD52280.1 Cas4 exonuclease [Mycobacterium phage JF2]BBC53784.1 putative exonuclease [Mycobacterium phage B1]AEK07433.1 Cas4 exonuclease [Mycobacterium phage Rockstar]
MTTAERKHRSVSQLKQYERCPYSYKLARIDKAWQRPAAWTAQGSAVHEAIEAWERSGRSLSLEEAQEVFKESYKKHIDAACEITPNFEWWFASGRYGGQLDIARRYDIGLEQVEKYINWATSHRDEVIWIAEDGTPGIELEFDIDLDGVLVRGYIDAVLRSGCGDEVYVRDHKTGNQPGDDFQLGVYKVALEDEYGVFAPSGDYWMGRTGKPTYPFDLTEWTRERVTEKFKELDENIRAERFDPKPDPDTCRFCDVSYACPFAVG